jgi:hypothetical protein
VIAVIVRSPAVSQLIEGIRTAKGIAHRVLEDAAGPLDYDDVERLAPRICSDSAPASVSIRSPGRKRRQLSVVTQLAEYFCLIAHLRMMPQFVLEDLRADLDWKREDAVVKTRQNEIIKIKGATVLWDRRENNHYRFKRGEKTDTLLAILADRRERRERGVLMMRTMTLLNALKPILLDAGYRVFELYGEMEDRKRARQIAGFRGSDADILLMTRTTGGRGLDLPFADYAVFYSPKSDPVQMWQEMSRIRSTVSRPKDIFVLCYEGEPEPGMLARVEAELVALGRLIQLRVRGPSEAG